MKTHIIRMTRNSSWRAFEHACDILRIACDPALMSERRSQTTVTFPMPSTFPKNQQADQPER